MKVRVYHRERKNLVTDLEFPYLFADRLNDPG